MTYLKYFIPALSFLFLVSACSYTEERECDPAEEYAFQEMTDSLKAHLNWPDNLEMTVFADAELVPSPACMTVSAKGDVYVGVDMIGSLGKEMGKGAVIKLIDCNGDGILDDYTIFAELDNPRGILALGEEVFVLHTRFSPETKTAENMDLVVFEDKDGDGIADGAPEVLIKDLSNPEYLAKRGTDHATNGIQIGIDGWIYIAVGDFSFYNATDASGQKMTMLGGGIVRVRPDGTEMEIFTHGLRNIYDVAIDPFMNVFTRDNTNDGGGWNIRFSHQIQTGEYGYPMLFKHFTEEIIPALVDAGGGSGTGALFLNDDRWPKEYNNTPLMADWGRNYLYRHVVEEDGPTYTQEDTEFIQLPQITDLDVDGAGIMYLSAWDGAGYSGSPDKGYIVRVIPEDFVYKYPGEICKKSDKELVSLLKSPYAKIRQEAQYNLLQRENPAAQADAIWSEVKNSSISVEARIAALYTYAQVMKEDGVEKLLEATHDSHLQEYALRALADRTGWAEKIPAEPFLEGLKSSNPRIQAISVIELGRLGKREAIPELLKFPVPASFRAPDLGQEGPHATPNSKIILPHLAVRALINLDAVDEVVNAVDTENQDLALWAMRYMHDEKVVNKLIEMYPAAEPDLQEKILHTLSRIYHKEAPYDATWWWGTRPDTHGPYYKTEDWSGTSVIRDFLLAEQKNPHGPGALFFRMLNTKYRLDIAPFGIIDLTPVAESQPDVDLEEVKNKKGQVGENSIEDVLLALQEIKGEPEKGKELFTRQGCQVCHSISKDEVMKGPFMGQIGSIMNREQIAESILKPDASISQGFATVQIKTKQGNTYVGFVTAESADKLTIRNIAGVATELSMADVAERKQLENSMMPEGLANALSYEEFASLVAFLEQQK